jgi:replicative DNA helicase
MMIASQNRWKSQKEGFQESLNYMRGRQNGTIKSFTTPWPKFNDAGTGGIEWSTTTIIAARPAGGKTLVLNQIVREAFPLNPGEDFNILKFELEMLARTSAIREYSGIIGRSYKYLCSADGTLTDEDLEKCFQYAQQAVKYPIDIVEEAVTVEEFIDIVRAYMEAHVLRDAEGKLILDKQGRKQYKKTLISFDHSVLLKKGQWDKSKTDTLYEFGAAVTMLKKQYPIAFIILSQLNREVENPDRCEPGKYGNYINTSDVFGSDALLQHADVLVALDRPYLRRIQIYGPDRYIIDSPDIMVWHFLKCRNGDPRRSFFRAEFERMSAVEMAPPPTHQIRTNK